MSTTKYIVNNLSGQTIDNQLVIPYNVFTATIDSTIVSTDSGLLEIDKRYVIVSLQSGDDFTNVGFPVGVTEGEFIATGTTPTDWSYGTVVYNMTDSELVVNKLQDTIDVAVSLEYLSGYTNVITTFRKTNGFPESKFWKNTQALVRVDESLIIKNPMVPSSSNQYEFKIYN